jgi:hypothetical protein
VDDVDDEGEDKIAARLEQLEPMEVVQLRLIFMIS